jgi:hypothetical protein
MRCTRADASSKYPTIGELLGGLTDPDSESTLIARMTPTQRGEASASMGEVGLRD